MGPASRVVVAILIVAGVAGVLGGVLWWRHQQTPPPLPPPAPVLAAPPAPADVAPVVAEPAIKHPLPPAEAESNAAGLPSLAEADGYITDALTKLLGRKAVLAFLDVDGFARRFVTTVDNLANERASPQLWPVRPTPGRFLTEAGGGGSAISARNAERYAPLVHFVETVDSRRAAGLYRRLYPLFQQAYEELGYPGKYFNDRVVEVIDHLLATPDLPEPVAVKLIEVAGAAHPGHLYQFADPALEARSAGQKILLRVGHGNAERLKTKLAEVRAQITQRPPR